MKCAKFVGGEQLSGVETIFAALHVNTALLKIDLPPRQGARFANTQPYTGSSALSCSHTTASRASLLGEPHKDETP